MGDGTVHITYRPSGATWEALFSYGERTTIDTDRHGTGLDGAQGAARAHLAARLGISENEARQRIGTEYVQVPPVESVQWHGLHFQQRAPDFGLDDPPEHQQQRLWQCYEYYRDNVPEGMRVEMYANRVRVEPDAFGQRRTVVDAVAGQLAEQAPDELDIVTAPVSSGLEQAREQFRRAWLLNVPEGFVRLLIDIEGFEEEGDIGVIYLLLKDRWERDSPL